MNSLNFSLCLQLSFHVCFSCNLHLVGRCRLCYLRIYLCLFVFLIKSAHFLILFSSLFSWHMGAFLSLALRLDIAARLETCICISNSLILWKMHLNRTPKERGEVVDILSYRVDRVLLHDLLIFFLVPFVDIAKLRGLQEVNLMGVVYR